MIGYDEFETVRLLDYEGYTQADCAKKMNVARTTVTRMYDNARRKIADALVNSKRLRYLAEMWQSARDQDPSAETSHTAAIN